MKKLSIIIPIYNGEHYVKKCVDSVISQQGVDLNEVEILLINDGSRDGSLTVAQYYEKRFPNIVRVIDRANKGAAYTRNQGIRRAVGKYIILLDQDDWIDEDYCAVLLQAIEKEDCEVVQSGFKLVDKNSETIKSVKPVSTDFGRLLAIPAWAKIYRADFLKNHDISFFENNIGEDSLFTLKVALHARKYQTIDYCGYNNYFDNTDNVTNTLHKGLSEKVDIIKLMDAMNCVRASTVDQRRLLDYNMIRTCMYYLLSYGKYATSQRFVEVNETLFNWMQANIKNFKMNHYVWNRPKGEHLSASLGIKLMIMVNSLNVASLFAKIYCKGRV